jgi:putative endonuclease
MYSRTRVRLPPPPPFDSRAQRAKSIGALSEVTKQPSRRALVGKVTLPPLAHGEPSGKARNSFACKILIGRFESRARERTVSRVFHVYVLRCSDDSLYVGHTADLAARMAAHRRGEGGRYTAIRRPLTLAYTEDWKSRSHAAERERQIKAWTKAKKEALLQADYKGLHTLARRKKYRHRQT